MEKFHPSFAQFETRWVLLTFAGFAEHKWTYGFTRAWGQLQTGTDPVPWSPAATAETLTIMELNPSTSSVKDRNLNSEGALRWWTHPVRCVLPLFGVLNLFRNDSIEAHKHIKCDLLLLLIILVAYLPGDAVWWPFFNHGGDRILFFNMKLRLQTINVSISTACLLCLPAYLSVCVWIKEYSVFPYCLLLPWPSIVSCLETAWKEVPSTSSYASPPRILPPLAQSPVYLRLSNPVPPSCPSLFLSPLLISNMLSLSSSIRRTESASHTMPVVSG